MADNTQPNDPEPLSVGQPSPQPPQAASPIPGIQGQFPVGVSKVPTVEGEEDTSAKRTPAEKAGELPEYVRQVMERAAQEVPSDDEILQGRSPEEIGKSEGEVDIEQMGEEYKREIQQYLEQQAAAPPQPVQAEQPKMWKPAAGIGTGLPDRARNPQLQQTPQQPAPQPEPEPEPEEEKPTSAFGDPGDTLPHCPRCGWDESQAAPKPLTNTDRTEFLEYLLSGRSYQKNYSLFGGAVDVRFRELSNKEYEAIYELSYAKRSADENLQKNNLADVYRRESYRLALAVIHLKFPQTGGEQQFPDSFEKWSALATTSDPVKVVELAHSRFNREVASEALKRAISIAHSQFERLVNRMVAESPKESFMEDASSN